MVFRIYIIKNSGAKGSKVQLYDIHMYRNRNRNIESRIEAVII